MQKHGDSATYLDAYSSAVPLDYAHDAEKIVQETTVINGVAIEFIDYPFYPFAIIKTRL